MSRGIRQSQKNNVGFHLKYVIKFIERERRKVVASSWEKRAMNIV